MIVAKFGGSSLADSDVFRQVRGIIEDDPQRRFIVVSAPGKRHSRDAKITDMLMDCHRKAQIGQSFDVEFAGVYGRFRELATQLGMPGALDEPLGELRTAIQEGTTRDYIVSRGEYLCARLMAAWMNLPFVDARDVVRFNRHGRLMLEDTLRLLREHLLKHERAVLPGFYGADSEGAIHTFTRGGSDISGALAAAAVDAELYENWTDVTGFRAVDPRIIPDASFISTLTYRELRELSYMGASVMHEEAIFPVRHAGIPTSIRNTGNPQHPGTLILPSPRQIGRLPAVTGIAGKRGFSTIILEKNQMNDEIGFGRKVLSVLEENHLNFEHLPTGIDALCVMVNSQALLKVRQKVLDEIEQAVHPDHISVQEGIALVACVGAGLFRMHGTIARLFSAVSESGIPIRTMFQAPSELSIIIGVNEGDLEKAIISIYDAFIR
ncbi:MAG: aspartate kinase [Clostridiales bacterium]|nr:aspartate kinase [Clostridiales bacterium]